MRKRIRVAVHGASGRMGSLAVQAIEESDTLSYAGAITRSYEIPKCDVVFDASSPEGLSHLITNLSGQALLIATTGDLPQVTVKAYTKHAAVITCSNFSSGIPLLRDALRAALKSLDHDDWTIEIIGEHHRNKKSVPSGTSKNLATLIQSETNLTPQITSLCEGERDMGGNHTVILKGHGEILTFKHEINDRTAAMKANIQKGIELLAAKDVGLYRL